MLVSSTSEKRRRADSPAASSPKRHATMARNDVNAVHRVLSSDDLVPRILSCIGRTECRSAAQVCHRWKSAVVARLRNDPVFFVFGGRKAHCYFPRSGSWRPVPPPPLDTMKTIPDAINLHSSNTSYVRYAGFVYALNFEDERAACYDPLDDTWKEFYHPDLVGETRLSHFLGVLNDTVYAIDSSCSAIVTVDLRNEDMISEPEAALTWNVQEFSRASIGTCCGYMFRVGGLEEIEDSAMVFGLIKQASTAVHRWRPGMQSWEKVASMNNPRWGCDLVEVDGRLYAMGGRAGSAAIISSIEGDYVERSCEVYCPDTNKWTVVTSLPSFRFGFSVVAVEHCIHVMGGVDYIDEDRSFAGSGDYRRLSSIDVFDTRSMTWSTALSTMPKAVCHHKCV